MNEELDMKEVAPRARNVFSPNADENLVITPQLGTDDDKRLYALEKSEMAVYTLATGLGNLKCRLVPAFSELIRIDASVLPANLQSDYNWIAESLARRPASRRAYIQGRCVEGFEGRIGATLAYMRHKKTEEIAIRIYDFNSRLRESLP